MYINELNIEYYKILENIKISFQIPQNEKNPCFTGIAPMDVILDEHNVVQPDVLLVCDRNKITEDHISGE